MKKINKVLLWLAVLGLSAVNSQAQYLLGSFQGTNDPTDAGWVNALNSNSIATIPSDFVAAGVPGYPESLRITSVGTNFPANGLQLNFSTSQIAAFNSNTYITFTFSVPSAAFSGSTAGYSQMYNLALNAPLLGYVNVGAGSNAAATWGSTNFAATGATSGNQNGMPNFYFNSQSPQHTEIVTFNYSSLLPVIMSNETYLQLVFQGNQGGGAPAYFYLNNVVLSTSPFGWYNATLLGSFQGIADPLNANFYDWPSTANGADFTNSQITNFPSEYSFVAAGVADYPESLQITKSGWNQDLVYDFVGSGNLGAFTNDAWLTFTYSVPASSVNGTTAGYAQIYGMVINAPTYGFTSTAWSNALDMGDIDNDSAGQPNFYFGNNSPQRSQLVTYKYSGALPGIEAGNENYLQWIWECNNGGGAPNYAWINNMFISPNPFGAMTSPPPTPPPAVPTMGIQKATPALRMFAGSTTFPTDREEVDTYYDGDEGWIGHTGATYSFTLLNFPVAPGFQCHLFLIPTASVSSSFGAISNEYVDIEASNCIWLDIVGQTANPNGSSGYTVNLLWKTNNLFGIAANEALALGYAYTNTVNQSPVGTWTLTFTSSTSGTLTPPGASALSFTISDPNVATDFAGPVMAVFGLQPNTQPGNINQNVNEGLYIDYASISITGTAHPISENFTTDPALGYTSITGGPPASSTNWDTSDSANPAGLILVNPTNTPLWVTWSLPAVGYGLGVSATLPTTAAEGITGGFIQPGFSIVSPTLITANIAGGTNWTLVPSALLPANDPADFPNGATNAYFELGNPPP